MECDFFSLFFSQLSTSMYYPIVFVLLVLFVVSWVALNPDPDDGADIVDVIFCLFLSLLLFLLLSLSLSLLSPFFLYYFFPLSLSLIITTATSIILTLTIMSLIIISDLLMSLQIRVRGDDKFTIFHHAVKSQVKSIAFFFPSSGFFIIICLALELLPFP